MIKTTFISLAISLVGGLLPTVQAQETPPPAYQIAATLSDVPSTVLYSIALQESGRSVGGMLRPWPWTLNVAGKSYYFDAFDAACTHLTETLKRTPAKRIDVGLGQINVGYHGHRATQPCDLLNPYLNLVIAGDILREQHRPGQDWLITMGKYHSPANGTAATRYRTSVQQHLERVQGHKPRRATPSKIPVTTQL